MRNAGARRRASRTDSGSGDHPAMRPSSTTGGATSARAEHRFGQAVGDPTVAAEMHDAVGVLHDAFEPVLGDDDRRPEVVHEPRDRGEHLLGRGGVERRCRFVEHEHARVRGQHRADRDALLLTARQRAQRAVAQLGQSEQVERFLDALAHHVGREGELLHPVRELFLDRVGDEARERVLADDTDDVGELARWMRARLAPVHQYAAGEMAAGEVRDQSVDRAEQRRLPDTGAADHEHELALVDREVDVAQHRRGRVRIGDGDVLEADHGTRTASGSARAGSGAGAVSVGRRRARRPVRVGSVRRPVARATPAAHRRGCRAPGAARARANGVVRATG